jgi:hypothetical protein
MLEGDLLKRIHKARSLVAIGCVAAVVGGCAPPAFVSHRNINQRAPLLKKIAVLPPRVDVFELGAGGVLEKMDDWSRSGSDNVWNAFVDELSRRQGVQVTRLDVASLSEDLKIELEQTQLLFDAVCASVVPHLYGIPAQRFEDKFSNFDYSLGAATAKLNVLDVDAFVLARGIDQISSSGRQALQVASLLAAAALGGGIIVRGGGTAMNIALVDARTGELLWYTSNRSDVTFDLRNPSSSASFIANAMWGFPVQ